MCEVLQLERWQLSLATYFAETTMARRQAKQEKDGLLLSKEKGHTGESKL